MSAQELVEVVRQESGTGCVGGGVPSVRAMQGVALGLQHVLSGSGPSLLCVCSQSLVDALIMRGGEGDGLRT